MCAIAGFFNFSGVRLTDPESLLVRMATMMAHRGPDDAGVWLDGSRRVGLSHRRLSILDLSAQGHQPMHGQAGCTITYNGEIYNFGALRSELNLTDLRSQTDTEVLLRAYEIHGEECIKRLNGMFAFAIWDSNRERLVLARDRAGIKPLYYSLAGGILSFASEIKALLLLPWIKPTIDERALYDFLSFNSLQAPNTMFAQILKLPPGTSLIADRSGVHKPAPFWKPRSQQLRGASEFELAELVRKTLSDSVSAQMVSDVPVGAFLSGGVDSSAVVAFMRRAKSSKIKTYSIGFEGAPSYDELEHARKIASAFDTDHIEKMVKPADLIEFLPRIVEIFDEPLADATAIPIYFISALARENGSTVVLTGDGSDELFCGYRKWRRYAQAFPFYNTFRGLPAPLRNAFLKCYRSFEDRSALHEMLSHAADGHKYLWASGGFRESSKRQFLDHEFLARINGHDTYASMRVVMDTFDSTCDSNGTERQIDWLSYYGFLRAVPDVYLYRADRLGMANSIEARVPFLDNEVIDLALSIPGRWKVRDGEPKYILKRGLEPVLSQDVLYRKKMGFCVPLREWMGPYIAGYVEENLAGFCRETGYFDEEAVRQEVGRARNGKGDFAFGLWNVYFLMAWMKRWVL